VGKAGSLIEALPFLPVDQVILSTGNLCFWWRTVGKAYGKLSERPASCHENRRFARSLDFTLILRPSLNRVRDRNKDSKNEQKNNGHNFTDRQKRHR
jgi:hypothetical protein